MIDSHEQLEYFRRAVKLLGGGRATAARLGVNERTIRDIRSGARALHTGFLRDVSAQLLALADDCRATERKLSPAFAVNLTHDQATKKPHGHAYHLRATAED